MTAPPHEAHRLPPEAALIRVARQARGLSPEKAADLTPIRLGGSRWREIEHGYKGKGARQIVRAPALTLAHMAHVVGVTPDRLVVVDREDAAEVLREIERQEAEQDKGGYTDPQEQAVWELTRLSEDDRREMIRLLRLGREARRRLG